MRAKIESTRTFSSDAGGMPVSRQLAQQQHREATLPRTPPDWSLLLGEEAAAAPSGDVGELWLRATGVPDLHALHRGAVVAAAVAAAEVAAAPLASGDPLGDAWLAATSAGHA